MDASIPIFKKAFDTALRILARREHTVWELRQKLSQRGFDEKTVAGVLTECRRLDYLDDARAAVLLLRQLKHKGVGIHRVRRDFRRRGLIGPAFDALMRMAMGEEEEVRIAQRVLVKKSGGAGRTATTKRGREERYRFLLSRGFSPGAIARVLRGLEE